MSNYRSQDAFRRRPEFPLLQFHPAAQGAFLIILFGSIEIFIEVCYVIP